MGFNKKYLTKETILSNLSNIDKLLKADALVMDMWSSYFVYDLDPKQRDLRKTILEDTQFDSSGDKYKSHPNLSLLTSISETLINLSTNPDFVDLHIASSIKTNFRNKEPEIINKVYATHFDSIVDRAINSIISYYDSLAMRDEKITEILK